MTADKLLGRMEEVLWSPPDLTFSIERHGAAALGSSRAELQEWMIDVVAAIVHGYRRHWESPVLHHAHGPASDREPNRTGSVSCASAKLER